MGGTLILAAGLALGSAPVVSAAGAEVDLDVVTKVVLLRIRICWIRIGRIRIVRCRVV